MEQTPSETHLQNATRHTILLGAEPIFFNDDFGRLTGSEPLFRGVRVAVIDPFFIICDNSPDESIIHGMTDMLTTNIQSSKSVVLPIQYGV